MSEDIAEQLAESFSLGMADGPWRVGAEYEAATSSYNVECTQVPAAGRTVVTHSFRVPEETRKEVALYDTVYKQWVHSVCAELKALNLWYVSGDLAEVHRARNELIKLGVRPGQYGRSSDWDEQPGLLPAPRQSQPAPRQSQPYVRPEVPMTSLESDELAIAEAVASIRRTLDERRKRQESSPPPGSSRPWSEPDDA